MFSRIRSVVSRIPRGKVTTYGEVARAAGFPGAARQVAWALHTSSSGLPWHRVVGAKGRILLPGHAGLEQKLRLAAEGVSFVGERVRMEQHGFRWPRRKAASKRKPSRSKTK